jgi:hypothetical protein
MMKYRADTFGQGLNAKGAPDDPVWNAMQQRQRKYNTGFKADRQSAISANMQTLLGAQAAGTTLTPSQLDWLTKMQGRDRGGA